MAGNKIGIGMIGLSADDMSWAARAHLPALKTVPDYEVRAAGASSAQSAAAAAAKHGVPKSFDNAAALAASPDVDVVVVTVKVPHHLELVSAAVEAGKTTYCEWPLGNGLKEAETLAALAKQKGVKAFVGLQARSSPIIRYIRDLVASGQIGEVISTTLVASSVTYGLTIPPRMLYSLQRKNGVSMLTIQFGHSVDALCWCLGEFRELSATLATRQPQTRRTDTGEIMTRDIIDQAAVSGTLESGAVCSIHFRNGSSPAGNLRWEIAGRKGTLLVTGASGGMQFGEMTLWGAFGDSETLVEMPVPKKYERVPAGRPGDVPYTLAQAYSYLLSDISDGTSELPTFADAVVRHRMIDAVERAAVTGKRESYDATIG